MARETTMMSLQIPKVEKQILESFARAHGMTMTDLFRQGARFIGGMSPGFIETLEEFYGEYNLHPSAILELTFQKIAASYRAWQLVFGSPPPGAWREFKMERGKLVRGDDLSKILEAEYVELYTQLRDKLLDSTEKAEAVEVSREELSEFCAQL